MLVTSIFSFSHNVFKRHFPHGHQKVSLTGEGLKCIKCISENDKPFLKQALFLCVCSIHVLKTLWEKEKLLITSIYFFSPQCFLPFWRTFFHFHQLKNCCLQSLSVWKSPKFVFWERVKRSNLNLRLKLHLFEMFVKPVKLIP